MGHEIVFRQQLLTRLLSKLRTLMPNTLLLIGKSLETAISKATKGSIFLFPSRLQGLGALLYAFYSTPLHRL